MPIMKLTGRDVEETFYLLFHFIAFIITEKLKDCMQFRKEKKNTRDLKELIHVQSGSVDRKRLYIIESKHNYLF